MTLQHPDDPLHDMKPRKSDLGRAFETLKSFIREKEREPLCKHCGREKRDHVEPNLTCKKYEK